jgi:DNA-binding CsgD family transcriptional regulator
MELLEREGPLADLVTAHRAAARGHGSVVLVTGEAGIGKTSLVSHFLAGLPAGARVLFGICDDLAIPRPLGPFRDITGDANGRIAHSAATQPGPTVAATLLEELGRDPVPTVLAVEDVQWADEATIDVLTVVARRVDRLPTMLVLTARGTELSEAGVLRPLLGALPPSSTRRLQLGPLSLDAVATLAGEGAAELYALTDGNPFFVTQLLAASPGALPPSVSHAVLALAARLEPDAQRLVELASVVPTRADARLLDAIMPGWALAAEEPERRGLMVVEPMAVRYRHELARVAIRSSIPVARRRRLHGEVLAALLELGADPANVVHHAEAAGAVDVVADHALVAARRATVAGANREAYAHFRRAAEFAERLPATQRADLYEELGQAAYTANHPDAAIQAIDRAIGMRRTLGDDRAVGRCLRLKSRIHWYAGDGAAARIAARDAVSVLEPLGPSAELGRAYGTLSQLAMLAGDLAETVRWGDPAVALAERFEDERARAHALINIGVARVSVDPDDSAPLLEGYRVADLVGDRHEATRALLGLSGTLFEWVRPAEAWETGERAIAYAERHQVDALLTYLRSMRARMLARRDEWSAAERVASLEAEREGTVAQLLAKLVLVQLAIRRGDSDAGARLAALASQADRTAELQHVEPVLELELEHALLIDAPMPLDRIASALALATPGVDGWDVGRLLGWAAVAVVPTSIEARMPAPHAAMARGDWRDAADAFGTAGWRYDRALLLSLLDDNAALCEALEIARDLGATPLAGRVVRRMRALGLRVPRGRRPSTRQNPLHLTDRQLEVLRLLADGLTNTEIAERLVVSPRTVEHHVAAVLTKLDAGTRREAVRRALTAGIVG